TPGGSLTTIAGNGTPCSSPSTTNCNDGPTATAANLSVPGGVALDGAGNVYIADTGDDKIRKLTPGGAISTIAGHGTTCAPTTAACGDGGAATAANLHAPQVVAVGGGGTVVFDDSSDNRMRWVPRP